MLKSSEISASVDVPGEARRFRRAFSYFSSLSDTQKAQSSLVGGTAGLGDEIERPLAMSWPLYQYSFRPGHCLTIFPYLLRYSAYMVIPPRPRPALLRPSLDTPQTRGRGGRGVLLGHSFHPLTPSGPWKARFRWPGGLAGVARCSWRTSTSFCHASDNRRLSGQFWWLRRA